MSERERVTVEQISRAFEVPYWLIDPRLTRPSWFRRPVVRFRAWWWAHHPPKV